jgi:hypothetical protein
MLAMFDQSLAFPATSVLRIAKQVIPLGSCERRARSGDPAADGAGAVATGAVVRSMAPTVAIVNLDDSPPTG